MTGMRWAWVGLKMIAYLRGHFNVSPRWQARGVCDGRSPWKKRKAGESRRLTRRGDCGTYLGLQGGEKKEAGYRCWEIIRGAAEGVVNAENHGANALMRGADSC